MTDDNDDDDDDDDDGLHDLAYAQSARRNVFGRIDEQYSICAPTTIITLLEANALHNLSGTNKINNDTSQRKTQGSIASIKFRNN